MDGGDLSLGMRTECDDGEVLVKEIMRIMRKMLGDRLIIRELAKSIGISHAKYEEKFETSSKKNAVVSTKRKLYFKGPEGKQTWWYRVESNTLTREDAELRFFERLLQESNLGGHRRISVDIEPSPRIKRNVLTQGERAEHATPGTLSTIVDYTSSSRMNHQAFFTRERAFERRNTTDISQAIRPLTRSKKTRRSKGRPRVVHDAFQVRGTVNHVTSDGTDIQYVGSSSIELEVGKGQPHIVHVKLEQGGLAAPLLARDTKTELGGFTYVKEVVKISSNFSAIVLKMEKIMTMIIQESEECAPELQALIKMITSFWVGKGSTAIPDGATNGLLISGVSVDPKKDKEAQDVGFYWGCFSLRSQW
ncbi:hypothetical protein Tco_0653422 [Tanacetum coccineum]|uniref:Uncharacterized protein n=1 Tax=Tanacetum coccineum TaxID=301880 RepID=A0ABQ4X0N1_9ASTR